MKGFFFRFGYFLLMISCLNSCAVSQPAVQRQVYTQSDSLRGSIGIGRDWWDLKKYDISVTPNISAKTISGYTDISFTVTIAGRQTMQIDLQQPMQIDSITDLSKNKQNILYNRSGNVYWLSFTDAFKPLKDHRIRIYFSGKPKEAVQPPWDGGWIWKKDNLGRPFVSVACQGIGASVWFPCKEHEADEADNGASLSITVPDELSAVGNGRLVKKQTNTNGTSSWKWEVKNPINSYLIIPYIGHYENFTDVYPGEKGNLDLSYWVLDYQLDKAKKHFEVVKPMMHCFEKWMGPYPFYEDSYKLVEAPHLGMEHQSAVAYGNQYKLGYMGMDRSGSGWGSKFDFIIIHESGHEWFGNSITAKDVADMWIHEAFTTYTETLFVECTFGRQAASEYVIGQRKNIKNSSPIIGQYGVSKTGSGDMYDKGANLIHTIRQVINDDNQFLQLLRGLSRNFYHQTVTTEQIENYIIQKTGKKLEKVFDQYLRTTKIPVLEYRIANGELTYRWANCLDGFEMPVKINEQWLQPSTIFKTIAWDNNTLSIDVNFYISVKQLQ